MLHPAQAIPIASNRFSALVSNFGKVKIYNVKGVIMATHRSSLSFGRLAWPFFILQALYVSPFQVVDPKFFSEIRIAMLIFQGVTHLDTPKSLKRHSYE